MKWLNPFVKIPTIMTAEEIIDFAHRKSTRLSMKSSLRLTRVERSRIREISRLQEFTKQVKTKLKNAVEDFPTLDRLHPFYYELAEILVGTDRLKQALGAVYNCIPPIDDITNNHIQALKLADDFRQMKKTRRAAKGRISSILRATAPNLDFIIEAKMKMARLPGVAPDEPTIVCAGFPNVGKSTLVKAVSTAEPEIAHYPFTTKNVIIGHLKVGNRNVQIIDTPGILDRPMSERNEIEKQGIAALKYLAHVIIFMIDPSEACGWKLEDQLNLHKEVRKMFPLNPLLVTFNKVDITQPEQLNKARQLIQDAHEIVATEGIGVNELMAAALEEVDLESVQESIQEFLAGISQGESGPTDN
ncbi:MAG: NOG1 family protein [Promethearchaeota archaeon]